MHRLLGLALLCVLFGSTFAFPNGAPKSACSSMIPNHGTDQQDDESPFILFVNVTDVHSLPEGDDGRLASSLVNGVAVTVFSADVSFAGFMLQAEFDSVPIGTFVIPKDGNGKLINCNGGARNTVTHSSRHAKKSETFLWIPPAGFSGEVFFRATVVENKKNWWADILSTPVSVIAA